MIVGCVAFPFGWNSNDFRKICGPESNRFELGLCGIRWAYPLAIIGNYQNIIKITSIHIYSMFILFSFSIHSLSLFLLDACIKLIFALTGCIDACILATLAFILATRHVRLQPEPMYQNSMFKGKFFTLSCHHYTLHILH